MGFIAKNATRKRVMPASGPLNGSLSGMPWTTTGAIPAGALVRSAVFAVGIDGVKTTSASAIGTFTPTYQAQVWLSSADSRSWRMVLGIPAGQRAITADWVVELVLDTQGRTATVVTSQYRAADGALMHADEHDKLRAELLRSLSLGVQSDADAEARITAMSLPAEQPFDEQPPEPFDIDFDISTSLDETAVRDRLRLVGHRVKEDTERSIRWGLGLPSDQDANEVTIILGEKMLRGHARVAGRTGPARRIAAADLRSFIERAVFWIKRQDAEATFRGPRKWAP